MPSFNYTKESQRSMQRPTTMLAIVGAIVAAGIALSFYGSAITIGGLEQSTANIGAGETLEITAQLDPAINEQGVLVVQMMEDRTDDVTVKVIGPDGTQIATPDIMTESIQDSFEITQEGMHTLIIQNAGESADFAGGIGHLPDQTGQSISVTGFFLLIMGLIGMATVGIYAVKSKKRSS